MKYGSLFSGIGGFDLGFDRAGMECAWQVEYDRHARSVLERHWPDVNRFNDVREVGKNELETVELICGGFPCQDVSVAGNREGLAGSRSGLWFEFHRILEEVGSEWVVIENVPGLLSSNGGRDFAVILRGLEKCGYSVAWRTLNSQFFGVPQRRRRVFIVGHLAEGRAAEILFEREGVSRNIAPIEEEGEDVGDSGYVEGTFWNGGQITQTLDAVLYKKQALPEKSRFPAVVVPAWIPCDMCGDFICTLHGEHAADCTCPGVDVWAEEGLYPYTPSVLRWLTPLECARLQGFPDDWGAGQSDTQQYKQFGNAVSVDVAEWLGKRIMRQ